jgi:hypothetical protein
MPQKGYAPAKSLLYQINSLLLSYPVKDSSRSFSYEKVVVVPVVVGALPKRALLLGRSPLKGQSPSIAVLEAAMPQKGQSERGFAPTHSNNNSHHSNYNNSSLSVIL